MKQFNFLSIAVSILLLSGLSSGCSSSKNRWDTDSVGLSKDYHPLMNVNRIAVVPFTAQENVDAAHISFDYSNTFTNELLRYGVKQVVRPDYVRRFMTANRIRIRSSADIVALGKRLDADLIIVAQLTDYYPYNPPRVAINLQVFSTQYNPSVKHNEIERWMTAGIPYSMGTDQDPNMPVVSVEIICDASQQDTYKKLKEYAGVHRNKDTSFITFGNKLASTFKGNDLNDYLNIMPKYFTFVSDTLIQTLLSEKAHWDLSQKRRQARQQKQLEDELNRSGLE